MTPLKLLLFVAAGLLITSCADKYEDDVTAEGVSRQLSDGEQQIYISSGFVDGEPVLSLATPTKALAITREGGYEIDVEDQTFTPYEGRYQNPDGSLKCSNIADDATRRIISIQKHHIRNCLRWICEDMNCKAGVGCEHGAHNTNTMMGAACMQVQAG